ERCTEMPPIVTENINASVIRNRVIAGSSVQAVSGSVADVVGAFKPSIPLYVYKPEILAANVQAFMDQFPGEIAYALKSNPDKLVINTLYRAGLRAFDVASIEEVRLVRKCAPKSRIYFMHPVKAPEAISE